MSCCPCAKDSMNPFCAALSQDVRQMLCRAGRPVRPIPCGTRLFRNGSGLAFRQYDQTGSGILLIQSGFGVGFTDTESGISICYNFMSPGSLFGSWYLFQNADHPFAETSYLEVLQPIRGCLFSQQDFQTLLLSSPALAQTILERTCRDSLDAFVHLSKMATYDSVEKVRYLLHIFQNYGVELSKLTHETIARILNLNRVTVTKALKTVLHEGGPMGAG